MSLVRPLNNRTAGYRHLLRREVCVREPDDLLKVPLVHFTQNGNGGYVAGRIPYVVDHTLEAGGIVRQRDIPSSSVRALQVEFVSEAIRRVPAVKVRHKVCVIWWYEPGREELADATRWNRVEITTDDGWYLGPICVHRLRT